MYQPTEYEFEMALLTPQEFKNTFGLEWFNNELETAEGQREGKVMGFIGGATKEMGDFRENQARKIWALDAVQFGNYITNHRIAIFDSLRVRKPVNAIAVDEYNKERGHIELPNNYERLYNFYVPSEKIKDYDWLNAGCNGKLTEL